MSSMFGSTFQKRGAWCFEKLDMFQMGSLLDLVKVKHETNSWA